MRDAPAVYTRLRGDDGLGPSLRNASLFQAADRPSQEDPRKIQGSSQASCAAGPGAVFIDIDERRNRLVFGVERDALGTFSSELQTFLRRTRVPSGAVIVEAAEPVVLTELLTDKIRPIPGGVQIATQPSNGVFGVGTLGVNAIRLGIRGFVTNAHFTKQWGQVDSS